MSKARNKKTIFLFASGIFFSVLFFGIINFTAKAAECPGNCVGEFEQPPANYKMDNSYTCPDDTPYCYVPSSSGSGQSCSSGKGECLASNVACSSVLTSTDCPSGQRCCEKTTGGSTGKGIEIPSNTGLPDPSGGILAIITNLLDWLLTVFLVLAVIAFVITGVQYLLAMGNARSNILESAKKNFTYAILAVTIVGAGLIIIKAVNNFLSASPSI